MKKHDTTLPELLKAGWDVGVAWQDGTDHGGTTHIRLNVALPFSRVQEALRRMDVYVFNRGERS
jgi:cystathionine beta-lyase